MVVGQASASPLPRRDVALVFGILFALYVITISTGHLSYDVYGANWTSWRLAQTGTPWLDGAPPPDLVANASVLIVDGAQGHTLFGRFPGVVVPTIPAYLLWPSDDMSTVPGSLTAALMTAGTGTLVYATLRRHAGRMPSAIAVGAYGLASPVWSVAANGLWPHTVSLFGIAGMGWAADRGRWWLVGTFGGVALWGRLHVALLVAVLGLLMAWYRRDHSILLRVAATSSAWLLGFCVWGYLVYGTWNPLGGYGDTSHLVARSGQYVLDVENQAGMWIAPDRGILVWTPIVVLLLPALLRSWSGLPDWSKALLVAGLVYTTTENMMNTFAGGDAFYGYRYGLEMLGSAAPALALSAHRAGPVARALLGPVLGVQLLAFVVGAANDSITLPESNAWSNNTFVAAVNEVGLVGWAVVGLAAMMGVLVARVLPSAHPHVSPAPTLTPRAPAPS